MAVGKSGYLDVTVMPQSVGKVRVYWREDYNVVGNYSTITVTDIQGYLWHRIAWAYVYASVTAGDVSVMSNTNGAWMFSAAADTTLRSVVSSSNWQQGFTPITSAPIYHNDNGSKTITLTLTVHDVTAPDVGFDASNNQTASQSIALTEIPRASDVTVSGGTIGAPLTISVNRANSSFLHTLTYCFGQESGTIVSLSSDVAFSWTPPMELCGQIPDANSGVCAVTCDTYSGGTRIGTDTVEVTLAVPDHVGLSVSDGWVTVVPYNEGTAAAGMDIFVQGYSAAQVNFDESKVSTQSAYGAKIAAFSIQWSGTAGNASHCTGVLTSSGSTEILCSVTDTRGRTVTEAICIEVLPYAKPTLSRIEIFRCDSSGAADDGGTAVSVKAACGISELNGYNYCILQAKYRSAGADYSAAETVESGSVTVLWAGTLSPRQTFEVQLAAEDALGNKAVYTAIIPTDDAFFHGRQGGKGAAFGKYAEEDDLLEVVWNVKTQKNLVVKENAEIYGTLTVGGVNIADLIAESIDPLGFMPVGYIYVSSDPTSPAAIFGGTWEQLTDRVIVGAGGRYAVDSTGGERTHKLTVSEMPSHTHTAANYMSMVGWTGSSPSYSYLNNTNDNYVGSLNPQTHATGGGQAHNNMQPYVAKYIWERVE